jgi:ferredoxin
MKVRIDPLRCESTGYCVAIDPAFFRLTPQGAEPTVSAGLDPDRDGDVLREAESLCPTGAIRVIED